MHTIETHVPQNKLWRHLSEYGLWNVHGNKFGLLFLPELTNASKFWDTTLKKPMWARTNTNPYSSDAIFWKPTPRRMYAHWKPVNVSGNWWQYSLAVSLPTSSFTTYDEPVLRSDPDTLRRPNLITGQTHPAANVQNCTDWIKNLLHFDRDHEDSWYTLTTGIVDQDRPAVFGPKDVSPVAVYSSPGSQDAGMYTRSELSSFWDSILISAASRNASKKFS